VLFRFRWRYFNRCRIFFHVSYYCTSFQDPHTRLLYRYCPSQIRLL
jgi:hypothetical protein